MKLRHAVSIMMCVVVVSAAFHVASAAEIRVLSLASLRSSLEGLVPEFEQKTGHKVTIIYGDSSSLPKRFAAAEPFDVALASLPLLERQAGEKRIVPGYARDVARVAIGIAVRKGNQKPDVSTPEALRRALLNARSVSHAAEGPAGVYFLDLLKRLGIAEAMQAKLAPFRAARRLWGRWRAGRSSWLSSPSHSLCSIRARTLSGALPDELQEYVV
jgi:molybdate transport system substrate-binding protein